MVEVVGKIKEAETQAEELKKQARQQAAQLKDDAVAAGKRLLDDETKRAQQAAALLLSRANADMETHLASVAEQSAQQCSQLSSGAKANVDKAAKFVVERIVNSL